MKNIFIWGSSSHAQCIVNIILNEAKYNLKFLFDPTLTENTQVLGFTVICNIEDLKVRIREDNIKGFTIGIGNNFIRKRVYEGYNDILGPLDYITTIHPTARIETNVTLGQGVVIMGGAFLETASEVGEGSWLGVNSSLGFSNKIGKFTSVAVNSCLGGNVIVGDCTAITMSVTILQKLRIGSNSIIGSGSLVTKPIGDNLLAYGVPAKVIRGWSESESYL